MVDEYAPLKKILADTVNMLATAQTFNVSLFLRKMEVAFIETGFRDKNLSGEIQSILLVRMDAAGDFILTTPAIRAVRENYPNAYITLVVSKQIYKLAELCPYVNEVIAIERPPVIDLQRDFVNAANFAEEHLWQRRFDLAICIGTVNNLLRNFLMYLSGARQRVTYLFDELGEILNTHCYKMSREYNVHDVMISLYLLKAHGLKIGNTDIEVWFNNSDLYTARRLLKNFGEGRIKVAVGIGANSPARKYPIEKYLVAFKQIIDKGASIMIFGGKSELDDAEFLEDNLPEEFVKNFVSENINWRVTMAAISQSDLYLGNDTGTQHVAAALKKPVIVLSRVAQDLKKFYKYETENELYRPWGTDAIVLQPEHQIGECINNISYQGCTAGKSHCIAQIEPSEIVDAFDAMIEFIRENY